MINRAKPTSLSGFESRHIVRWPLYDQYQNGCKCYNGFGQAFPTVREVRDEYQRLAQHPLPTLVAKIKKSFVIMILISVVLYFAPPSMHKACSCTQKTFLLRKRGRPRKVTSTSQNKHVPSPSTATTAVSNRTIHPSTRATTTTANYVSSPGRRRIHRGRL
ncbi:hypothetical protein TNCV_3422161 [Trichonephila clavipes]|nr:hypothetical protein TNCV_3422161 [Trichonephila clavipes]